MEDVFSTNWKGREHEAISRYCFGHLQSLFGNDDLFRDPAQICIQGMVVGVPGKNPNGRVNKDLLIWPPERSSCWDESWTPRYAPLCIQEWKVFRPSTGRLRMSKADLDWLRAFSEDKDEFVGYAVSLDLADRGTRLSVTRVYQGEATSDWFRS